MTSERRKLVERLFLHAAELPEMERLAFLVRSRVDQEVFEEVRSLLRYDSRNPHDIDEMVSVAAESLLAVSTGADPMVGGRLGPYLIQGELGRGGMGAVYLAVRDDRSFHKHVALKVVKRGMDTDAVLERFRHERQILANLDHPNIARLLDGGTMPDGRPYFVMEYVEGQPIHAYCSRQNLDRKARLELFRKVCAAVAAAHRNLVVHRDLKPGNILVTATGEPKLLDFGIAKLLGADASNQETLAAARILTPDYASPEQLRGEPVTTASDVYSLGVLLVELLTGTRPAAGGCLEGELRHIAGMALRSEPERRYLTVDALSEDIRRYLHSLPVLARGESARYRAGKFLRRHWISVSAASLAAVCLIGGLIIANVQRRHAEARLAAMLGMANKTLMDVQGEMGRLPGATDIRRRMMSATLKDLDELARDASDNAEFRRTLGMAYLRMGDVLGYPLLPNLGDREGAMACYRKAEKLLPKKGVERGELLLNMGELEDVEGHRDKALTAFRQGLLAAHYDDTDESLKTQGSLHHAMAVLLTNSEPENAITSSYRSMEIYTKLAERKPDDREVVDSLVSSYSSLGGALGRFNRLDQILPLYRKGVAIRERLAGKYPNDVVVQHNLMISYGRLGDLLGGPIRRNMGDRAGALQNYTKALGIAESLESSDPNNSLGQSDLAQILVRTAALKDDPSNRHESVAMLDRALDLARKARAGKAPSASNIRLVAMIEEYRGRRQEELGDPVGALASYRRSLASIQALLVHDRTDFASLKQEMEDYGAILAVLGETGRLAEVERTAAAALKIAQDYTTKGSDPSVTAVYIAEVYGWTGRAYEELARHAPAGAGPADWKAAALNYRHSVDEWHKFQGRPDYKFLESSIHDVEKHLQECLTGMGK